MYLFIYLSMYLFIHLFIYSFIYLFIYFSIFFIQGGLCFLGAPCKWNELNEKLCHQKKKKEKRKGLLESRLVKSPENCEVILMMLRIIL